ncbi:MAG: outer membrane lipoprotein-sorting protein [Kofleriaceae bacterium]|nr:MAG: outer membrane lipoprotein-sorting protein [Kofleriaceae bacterium]MBZ0235025.1 outer membrane lipoprotein-sorting protein [Kofleriaceae bacterium]
MKRTASLLVALLVFLPAIASAELPSGREVLEKQEEARKIPSFQARAMLTTTKAGGSSKAAKKFRWWRKLSDQTHFVTLTRFDEPATIRGEGVLIREGKDRNDVLLYLPHFKKVRRVEGQSQSSSFFGSVFSYSDVAMPHADDSTAKVLREETCPGEKLKCFVVEISPATKKIRDRTGYSRSVQWIRQDNWITVAGEFYDLKGKLWKKLRATEVKEVDARNKKWMPHHIVLEDVVKKRTTVLRLADVKVNVSIDDSVFTEQNLASE